MQNDMDFRRLIAHYIELYSLASIANECMAEILIAHYIELYSCSKKKVYRNTVSYCSLYRAVFTGLYSCSNVNGNLIPYCSLYRAVFTTVYIILSISENHLFSHKSTYYY